VMLRMVPIFPHEGYVPHAIARSGGSCEHIRVVLLYSRSALDLRCTTGM